MNIEMEERLRNMSVPALAARCLCEINIHRRGETVNAGLILSIDAGRK